MLAEVSFEKLGAAMKIVEAEMGSLIVRKLDGDVIAKLRVRAAQHGRSMEAEHREILRQALQFEPIDREEFMRVAADLRARTAGRKHTPAEEVIREGRDER